MSVIHTAAVGHMFLQYDEISHISLFRNDSKE